MNVCPGCPAGELAGVGNRGIPYCLLLCCISLITGCAAPHPPKPGSPGYGEGVSPVDDLLPGLYSTSLQERADTIHDIAATGEVAVVPLLDELIVADDDDRMWVAEVLVAIGEPVVEDVGELLGTLDPALDRVVMWILGRIGSGPAMQVLMTVVLDEYNWLRPDAIEAIGLTGSDEAISALIVLDEKSLSGFPNPISDELGEIGEPAAMAVIERLAGCPASEDDNCMSGRLMLSYIGASSLPLVLSLFESQDSSDRDLAAFLIEGLLGHDLSCGTCMQIRPTEIIYEAMTTPPVEAQLISLLDSEDDAVIFWAMHCLGFTDAEIPVEKLDELVDHPDETVSRSAVLRLVASGDESRIPTVLASIGQEYDWHDITAVWALGEAGSEEALPTISNCAGSEDISLVDTAIDAMGKIGDPESLTTIEPFLTVPAHCEEAAEAMVMIGTPEAAEHIAHSLSKHKDSAVHMYCHAPATDAIQDLGPLAIDPLIEEVAKGNVHAASVLVDLHATIPIEELLAQAAVKNKKKRQAAAIVLGSRGDAGVLGTLVDMMESDESLTEPPLAARSLGSIDDEKATQALIDALESDNDGLREAAALALGEHDHPEAIGPLARALLDEDKAVRCNAAWSLSCMTDEEALKRLTGGMLKQPVTCMVEAVASTGDPLAIDSLASLLDHPEVGFDAARVLISIGEPAIERVLEVAEAGVSQGKIMAATVLASLKHESAIGYLLVLLLDPNNWVRAQARKVLVESTGLDHGPSFLDWYEALECTRDDFPCVSVSPVVPW